MRLIDHPAARAEFLEAVRFYRQSRLLYRVMADGLKVVAYKHHRRHPDYWLGRLNV